MKAKSFIILVALATALVGEMAVHSQITPPALSPFVVSVTQSSWDVAAPVQEPRTVQYAVRRDGSYVEIFPEANAAIKPRREVMDFQKGLMIGVQPVIEAISTMKMYKVAMPFVPARDCPTDAGEEETVIRGKAAGQILGQDVDMSENLFQIPPGGWGPGPYRLDEKTWMAPALGCFVLRREQREDKYIGGQWVPETVSMEQAVRIDFVPVDEYFTIPPGYTEMATGDVFIKLHELSPSTHPAPNPAMMQKMNDDYYQDRS